MISFSLLFAWLIGLGFFGLGVWVTGPLPVVWRWVTRIVLVGLLCAFLSPAETVEQVREVVERVIPLAASASQVDKAGWVVHFLLYTLLSALLFFQRCRVEPAVLGLGLVVLAVVTESLQLLIEGREAAIGDLVINWIGVAAGYFVGRGMGVWVAQRD